MPILALLIYHLIFYWSIYKNPYKLCTSEIASTYFPHWTWLGRQLRSGIFPAVDDIYYKLPASIPFLSTFYPFNLLTAWLGSFCMPNRAFRLYAYSIVFHSFIGSLLAYILFSRWCDPTVALFGAITYSYSAYLIKPLTPASMFLTAWIPGIFLDPITGIICTYLTLTAGYYPPLVYLLPFAILVHPLAVTGGFVLALCQVLPFLGYFKNSVRSNEIADPNQGRIPFHRLINFVFPFERYGTSHGVIHPETSMYMGFLPFIFIWYSYSRFWIVLGLGLLVVTGFLPSIQRIPSRALFIMTLSITILATDGLSKVGHDLKFQLVVLISQAILLLRNRQLLDIFPFRQWWNKPSRMYKQTPKAYKWPYTNGYLIGERISDYEGSFRLR